MTLEEAVQIMGRVGREDWSAVFMEWEEEIRAKAAELDGYEKRIEEKRAEHEAMLAAVMSRRVAHRRAMQDMAHEEIRMREEVEARVAKLESGRIVARRQEVEKQIGALDGCLVTAREAYTKTRGALDVEIGEKRALLDEVKVQLAEIKGRL